MRAFRAWTLAISLAAHAALLLLLLQWHDEGARSAGVGGIEVALGPAGGAPGTVEAVDTPVTETLDSIETARPVEALDVPSEEAPSVEARPVDPPREMAAVEPKPAPAVAAPAAPAPSPPVISSPSADESAPAAPPAETAERRPRSTAAVPPEVTQARPVEPESTTAAREPAPLPAPPPKPVPPRGPSRMTERPARAEPARAAEQRSAPGAAGRAGAGERAEAGADTGGAGGGLPGDSADYLDLLQAWLERHKEYPRRAQMRRQEGTALLRFVMDRDGHVLSYRIEQSSGHAALDEAVEAMLERAEPLPAMPPDMAQARLELVVPVTFQLR